MAETINLFVAARLDEIAQILEEQGANIFRVRAYQRAATMLRNLKQPLDELVRNRGIDGLVKLPGIGDTLARFIHQLVVTGRLPMLDRLRGESDPIALMQTVPGVGKVMARRLHDELGIETLEELEMAAHDGRLEKALGFGPKRIAGIRDTLASRLGRFSTRHETPTPSLAQPPVSEILDVDNEYRKKASSGLLPRIAPRRFNPKHERWLPILHSTRGERHYTALFSNTARAHQLGKTSDWVVMFYDNSFGERQCTVITAGSGALEGRRIVRGREAECWSFYFQPIASESRQTVDQEW
jgi:putative hydrolase